MIRTQPHSGFFRSMVLCAWMVMVTVIATSTVQADEGNTAKLQAALDAQPAEVQARYAHRHPAETLAFFGIKPGMTVVEALPGGGWYSKILLPYLGANGRLIGADYAPEMWPLFGFFGEEFIASRKSWVEDWAQEARAWPAADGARIDAFQFGYLPDALEETADAVLLIRALHNLARFEGQGQFLSKALGNVHAVLKPGGIVGVVQHEARADMPDDWASGAAGYLKRDFVISQMEAAGFEFVAAAEFNQNPLDQPSVNDVVWRLPPSLQGAQDNPDLKAQMEAIGESNRMTLMFRKP